ncbi:hypothetical protein VTP01DRAFT_5611 [Rhizomucor pusillus]|uniref:uncharacterized protein n=1 Tax=Rhizomucor pusillus TaxID=4840 RepID=UPI0037426327
MFTRQGVIRLRFLTPFKIVLLILVKRLCANEIPRELLSSYIFKLLKFAQLSKALKEPPLDQVYASLREFDDEKTVKDIQTDIESYSDPYSLHMFMEGTIASILDLRFGAENEIALGKASVLGLFVRRCLVEYHRTSFPDRTKLFTIFRLYATGYTIDRDNISYDETGEYCRSVLVDDPLMPGQVYEYEGWITDNKIEKFLGREAEKIEKTGSSDISPSMLHKYMSFIEQQAPDIGRVHQLRFLNYIRTGEYEAANDSLRRFFDSCLDVRDIPIYQYALLNLGIMEVKFGHASQALAVFEEALSMARDHQDPECLNEILSWVRYIQGIESSQVERYPLYTVNENTAANTNVIFLEIMSKLAFARELLRRGDSPEEIFEQIQYKPQQSVVDDDEFVCKSKLLLKSFLWKYYGELSLSKMYLDAALDINVSTFDDAEKTCILAAEMHADTGEFEKAFSLLDRLAERYPDQCEMSLAWKYTVCRLRHRLAQSNDYSVPETKSRLEVSTESDVAAFVSAMTPDQYSHAVYERALEMSEYYDKTEEATFILQEHYGVAEKSNNKNACIDNLLATGDLLMIKGNYEQAAAFYDKAVLLSHESYNMLKYYAATVSKVEALLHTNSWDKDVKTMLDQIAPSILENGSLDLKGRFYKVYSQLLFLTETERSKAQEVNFDYPDDTDSVDEYEQSDSDDEDITQSADKWLYYAVKAKKAYTTAERIDKAEEVQTMIRRYKELQL